MGLDMYLTKEIYVGQQYKHRNVKGIIEITVNDKKVDLSIEGLESLKYTAGYWRKANAIHNYFVQKHADGVDECQDIEVSSKELLELRDICQKVLKDNSLAGELLPAQSGFFFGNTDYDQYYLEDLTATIKIIDDAVEKFGEDEYFTYRASW